jgi:YHS domain-containing protein
MIRLLILRVLPLLLLFLVFRSVVKSILMGSQGQPKRNPAAPTIQPSGDLQKDPVCGAFVSPAASVTRNINGTVVHFCSAECRDKYRVA